MPWLGCSGQEQGQAAEGGVHPAWKHCMPNPGPAPPCVKPNRGTSPPSSPSSGPGPCRSGGRPGRTAGRTCIPRDMKTCRERLTFDSAIQEKRRPPPLRSPEPLHSPQELCSSPLFKQAKQRRLERLPVRGWHLWAGKGDQMKPRASWGRAHIRAGFEMAMVRPAACRALDLDLPPLGGGLNPFHG